MAPFHFTRESTIQLALEKLYGGVRVSIAIAEDVNARPRKIANLYAAPNILMRVTEFDQEIGELRAHRL